MMVMILKDRVINLNFSFVDKTIKKINSKNIINMFIYNINYIKNIFLHLDLHLGKSKN